MSQRRGALYVLLYVWIFFNGVVDVLPLIFEYKARKYHEFCCWNPRKLAEDYFYFIADHFYQTTPLSGKKWNVRSEATISLKDKCGRGRRGTVEECDGLSRCRPTGQNPPPTTTSPQTAGVIAQCHSQPSPITHYHLLSQRSLR